ncbi:CLUMA_CG000059, isoform A [Clunio marinus]|uniref:CLUMA_CG000059, isoform A n=1 Tax=Clunio marinus TaxID=568069 RepID=A0A1J1HE63_9DIPT|nr:CLUMA_CG000059, isoform A [Clunio marinus]
MNSIDKVRIIVAGDSGCGKSSLAYLIANNEAMTNPPYTVGCSVEVKLHEYREDSKREFFIEASSLSHKNTRGVFYQQANGIILVHDLTNRKSHENLKYWLYEILNKESGKDTIKSFAEQDLDSEQFLGSQASQIPVLVVGTKFDLLDEKQKKTNSRNQQFSKDIGAEEIFIDCRNIRSFHAGSTEAVKLSKFFDRVIEKKYILSDNSTFNDKRKFINIKSPMDSSSRFISPFTSPLGNYSNFSSNLASNLTQSPTSQTD